MGFFRDDSDEAQAHSQVTQNPHASITHELIGAAAAYEATKAYEKHVGANGKPDSHAKAKEILAGAIGAFVDREAETRGLNFLQKEKVKHDAKKRAESALGDSGEF